MFGRSIIGYAMITDWRGTHFLQLYLGFTPKLAHAFDSGDPALKSFFFPL
jgi:hypothetical protein